MKIIRSIPSIISILPPFILCLCAYQPELEKKEKKIL